MSTKDLGLVTAYGYAKEGGFEGTESEFKALLGNVANDLAEIESISASAETLTPGSDATATYDSGALEFGIPEGLPGRGIVSIAKTAESGAVKTYTMTFTDNTTFTFDVTDGEVTDDSLAETLEDYAKIDGYYQDMSVGDAEQLVSTIFEEDSTPYLFRTSGGSIDIGDREYDEIVGGTVAWNQLIPDNYSQLSTSMIALNAGTSWIIGHKYLFYGKRSSTGKLSFAYLYTRENDSNVPLTTSMNIPADSADKEICKIYNAAKNATSLGTVGLVNGNLWIYRSTPDDYIKFDELQLFDLTLMFGSTIADYIYTLETNHAGDGVAFFRKLFPKPYYAYDAGTLKSVSGLKSHDMRGFNAWDEEWEEGAYDTTTGAKTTYSGRIRNKNLIPILPSTTYYMKAPTNTAIYWKCYYDANGVFIKTIGSSSNSTFTTPQNAYYMSFYTESAYGSATYQNDICINISWDGERDGEYEEYVKHSYALDDSLTLRGIPKLDVNNKLYYDGDTYESDGTVTRKYGIVDLGSLNWNLSIGDVGGSTTGEYGFFLSAAVISNVYKPSTNANAYNNGICTKYLCGASASSIYFGTDGGGHIAIAVDGKIRISRTDDSMTAAQFKTAVNGVYFVYELATPTTESAEPYTNPQIVDDFGTEEYIGSELPVGHNTDYPMTMVDCADGLGNGTYEARLTIANGVKTFTWQSV